MNQAKHEFALYWPKISSKIEEYPVHALFKIDDKDLVHRIVTVLRLHQEDQIILFDKNIHVFGELGEVTKKHVYVQINAIEQNRSLTPSLTVGLPVLKKEAFEVALYSLTELGANAIQSLITKKVHRPDWSAKETERSERILIAAAEQSKQFVVPETKVPVSLDVFIQRAKEFEVKVFFDPHGQPCKTFFETLTLSKSAKILLLIGPEGDLTLEEKELLKKAGFVFVALTPTVLRSQQAVAVGIGIFRAMV